MSLRQRINTFWDAFRQHEPLLRRYAQRGTEQIPQEAVQAFEHLSLLARTIHPELELRLLYAEASKVYYIDFPFTQAPYLYYIQRMMDRLFPLALYGLSWCLLLGRICERTTEEQQTYRHLDSLRVAFEDDNPTRVLMYSDELDLYDPKVYYACVDALRVYWGETTTALLYTQYEVVDDCPLSAQHPLELVPEELGGLPSENKLSRYPSIPFDPLHHLADYEIPLEGRAIRNQGRTSYIPLLAELETVLDDDYLPLRVRPNIQALERAGISVISLHFHYPEDAAEACKTAEAWVEYLEDESDLRGIFLPIGNAYGGELGDIYIADFLCGDRTMFVEALRPLFDQGNCLVELIDHTATDEQGYQVLFDPQELSIAEMERRRVASVTILAAIEALPHKTLNDRLIEGRALNGAQRFEEAIDCFEACQWEAKDDPRLYYGLAHAYRMMAQLSSGGEYGYALLARDNYLRSIELGHRITESKALLARLHFSYDLVGTGGEASYLKGMEYLSQAKEDEKGYLELRELFYDDEDALTPSERMLVEQELTARYGEPDLVSQVLLPNGYKFDVLYYEPSVLSKGHPFILTRGISEFYIHSPIPRGDKPYSYYRMEHLIVLPKDTQLMEIATTTEHWTMRVFSILADIYCEEVFLFALNYIDHSPLYLEQLEGHPYEGHKSFLLRSSPDNIFERAADAAPIYVTPDCMLKFVSITPLFDQEARLMELYKTNKLCNAGLDKLPHYPDPNRVNIGASIDKGEFDYDEMDDLFGSVLGDS